MLWKGLAVAVLVAAVLVPVASARSTTTVKLAVLPLPKSALGTSAGSLALDWGSGAVSNVEAASNSFSGASPRTFKKMGRIGGFRLDYGIGQSGGSGVTEISTQVDQYKTSADAKKGLAFWKKDGLELTQLDNAGHFVVINKAQKTRAVGTARFAYLSSFSETNITPVSALDEQFTDGRYELEVTVWAGSPTAAKKLAPLLAKKLDQRLREALAGKLPAKPVKLPSKPAAGPPAGGPDLSTLALQTSDLTGSAQIQDEQYFPFALSNYSVLMSPAGPFDLLDQEIYWYPTANEASFWSDWDTASFLSGGGSLQPDVSSVGDGAQGVIDNETSGGFAQVVLSSGHLSENIFVLGQSIQQSDLQNLAQSAANYIDNAGLNH